ncbi:hypothetical protein PVL29_019533 [Vitis rotundifolia]|uniref:Uncharacterized protein n=1 Tax=Vitis rotundifolia TaxID=103349 RepID=A0AA38Z0S3_VITRO|nr:hypothetical protein PVL29_019533 [Vitis rotundifolia]
MMIIHNSTVTVQHLTLNIAGISLQQQRNLIPIHSAVFINNVEIHHGQHQNRMSTHLTSILAFLSFIVPVLLDLVDLKFGKEAHSVFEAHPTTTKLGIASLLAFVLASELVLIFHTSRLPPTCAALLRTTMVFSASLLLASLASLLFPDALRPHLYVLHALLSLGNLHSLVRKWCRWVHRTIMENLLETAFTGMRRQSHMERRPSTCTP